MGAVGFSNLVPQSVAYNDHGRPVEVAMRVDSSLSSGSVGTHKKGFPWLRQTETPDLLMIKNCWTWTEGLRDMQEERRSCIIFQAFFPLLFELWQCKCTFFHANKAIS